MTYFDLIKKLRSYETMVIRLENCWVFYNLLLSRSSLIRKSGKIKMRRLSTYCNLQIFTWKIAKIAKKLVYPDLIKFDLHCFLDFWLWMTSNDLESNFFKVDIKSVTLNDMLNWIFFLTWILKSDLIWSKMTERDPKRNFNLNF